jgi:hypothetical protein
LAQFTRLYGLRTPAIAAEANTEFHTYQNRALGPPTPKVRPDGWS